MRLTQSSVETPLEEQTKTFGGLYAIRIELSNGSKLAVGQNSLKSPTPLRVKTFNNRPEGGDPRFKPIGLRTVVQVHATVRAFVGSDESCIICLCSSLRGRLRDGCPSRSRSHYRARRWHKSTCFWTTTSRTLPSSSRQPVIESVLGAYLLRPETLRVSVQPVDAGDFSSCPRLKIPAWFDSPRNNRLQTRQAIPTRAQHRRAFPQTFHAFPCTSSLSTM